MDKSVCGCEQSKSWLKSSQYYQEVGAELLGNKIFIRIERDKNKLNKLKKLKDKSKDWDPLCVCTDPNPNSLKESRVQGPKIITVGNNEIIFRLNSRCRLSCEDQNYSSQFISSSTDDLKVSRPEKEDNKIQVFSQLDQADNYDVYQDHKVVGGKNLFLMKINKKSAMKDFGTRNIELEVSYPKIIVPCAPPTPSPPPAITPTIISPPPPPEVKQPEIKVTKPETKKKKSKAKKKK